MSQKTAKKLRKLVRDTSPDGVLDQSRVKSLTRGWNKTPSNHRGKLMKTLDKAASLLSKKIEAQSDLESKGT